MSENTQKPVEAQAETPVQPVEVVVPPVAAIVAAETTPAVAKKAAPKAAARKPAAKPGAKPVATKAKPAPVAKPAATKAPVEKAVKAEKPAKAPKAKPVKAEKPAKAPKAEKPAKVKKIKLVRDSYAMPEAEYAKIGELKKRMVALGSEVKKSELLRGGIAALAAMTDTQLQALMAGVERIKTGRPAK